MSLLKPLNRFADRGAIAERHTQKYLSEWSQTPGRDFSRLVDSKAAGRTIQAAAADFEFYASGEGQSYFGLIEVKETRHAYRLERKRLTQLPRLRKRTGCGATCLVLVLHSSAGSWRCLTVPWLMSHNGVGGSWDLREQPQFASVREALHHGAPEVFR